MTDIQQQLVTLIDFTSLNEKDTEEDIVQLCQKANTPHGPVAAVCIYPQFVALAKNKLNSSIIKIATVVNFPSGDLALTAVVLNIQEAIRDGANEIDVVMPYKKYLAGNCEEVMDFIKTCKTTCGENVLLKVILESGAFDNLELLANASRDMIFAGADFLKTSTGKIPIGATLASGHIILNVIKDCSSHLEKKVGFKVSGGVRNAEQAMQYINLTEEIMGVNWLSPKTFRIGTSRELWVEN